MPLVVHVPSRRTAGPAQQGRSPGRTWAGAESLTSLSRRGRGAGGAVPRATESRRRPRHGTTCGPVAGNVPLPSGGSAGPVGQRAEATRTGRRGEPVEQVDVLTGGRPPTTRSASSVRRDLADARMGQLSSGPGRARVLPAVVAHRACRGRGAASRTGRHGRHGLPGRATAALARRGRRVALPGRTHRSAPGDGVRRAAGRGRTAGRPPSSSGASGAAECRVAVVSRALRQHHVGARGPSAVAHEAARAVRAERNP